MMVLGVTLTFHRFTNPRHDEIGLNLVAYHVFTVQLPFHQLQLASEMKEALRNEEFYEGDNPLEDNDNDKGDNEELTDDDEYSSEEDEEDTMWGKRGVSSSVS